MRIAIVNDVPPITYTLNKILGYYPELEVAWTANDGQEAIDKCKADLPDIILMDLIMPNINGVQATRAIMKETPCAILIVTSSVTQNASMVFEAMGAGALDAVNTPDLVSASSKRDIDALYNKIKIISRLIGKGSKPAATQENKAHTSAGMAQGGTSTYPIIAIGSSTGGPAALAELLSSIPTNIHAAIVIIQHVDKAFAPGMAQWLNEQTGFPVRVAAAGDIPKPGQALLAATNDHLILNRHGNLVYTSEPEKLVFRPSVDVFYESVNKNWNNRVIAVLLTGMGKDGATGLLALKQAGAYTIAQDQKTCAVFGMPKAAIALDAAMEILPISKIGPAILQHIASDHMDKQQGVK